MAVMDGDGAPAAPGGLLARLRAILGDSSDTSLTNRLAGTIYNHNRGMKTLTLASSEGRFSDSLCQSERQVFLTHDPSGGSESGQ